MGHAARKSTGEATLQLVLGWAQPPEGYTAMPSSKKGGYRKTLTHGVSVLWYPGADPAAQARKERAAERRVSVKVRKEQAAQVAIAAETARLVAKARAEREASAQQHRSLMARIRELRTQVEQELAALTVDVSTPPAIPDMTAHAVLIPEPPLEAFLVAL